MPASDSETLRGAAPGPAAGPRTVSETDAVAAGGARPSAAAPGTPAGARDLGPWERLILNLRAARARAYVRVVATGRELSWLPFEVGLPILAAAAYVFIYEALGAPAEYTGFVLLGGAMTAYWMNVLWNMASQFYWEKQSGLLETYFLAPASRVSLLFGMAMGGIFMSSIRAAATLAAGSLIFGITYHVVSWPATVAAFVLTLSALYCLGMLFASVFLMYGREAWHMASALQEPVYLASGFYFPVRALGFWAAMGASVIPLTLGLDAMRQLVFGMADMGFLPVAWELAGLAGLTVVYFGLALRALSKMEHLAKKAGRLTLKWQ
ncbi:MAG: ABC transporter permease [Limnochordales bacterium]